MRTSTDMLCGGSILEDKQESFMEPPACAFIPLPPASGNGAKPFQLFQGYAACSCQMFNVCGGMSQQSLIWEKIPRALSREVPRTSRMLLPQNAETLHKAAKM